MLCLAFGFALFAGTIWASVPRLAPRDSLGFAFELVEELRAHKDHSCFIGSAPPPLRLEFFEDLIARKAY